MVTTYILILTLSAWLLSYGLTFVHTRTAKSIPRDTTAVPGLIALITTLGFFTVVAAPAWMIVLTIAILLAAKKLPLPQPPAPLSWLIILITLIPLTIAPLLGAPSYLALDAALIAASILGTHTANPTAQSGPAFIPFLTLITTLALHALMSGVPHAS